MRTIPTDSASRGRAATGARIQEAVVIPQPIAPPTAGEPGAHALPPAALGYEIARSAIAIGAAAVVAAAAVLLLAPEPARPPLLAAVAALAAVGGAVDLLVLDRIRVRSTSWTATEDFVYIASGRLVRRSVLVPVPQVLGVEVAVGPLLRRAGLVRVRFVTIGDGVEISAVTAEQAASIRGTVLGQRGVADA
ncbi:PH domain-containing protein [Agrococcus sp. SL85]|uniref:PH domain-containing protein n=1 Tax=Agrococcus sp. SL85 TaxID=2995141 RepID=UPI00226CD520|nr:PH domain-containing protein [Agrococcus sp. SL85]WAC65135.1 PH domain-containing protein [Agrococcus sp. SL85]